jgi:glycosyltransferase involved in cell wall biosynthesis
VKLVFYVPPAEQRVGGLDSAIQGLRGALKAQGIAVLDEVPDNTDGETVVHFHGLWQPAHIRVARRCFERGIPYLVSPHGMLESWAWRHKWWKKWPYFRLIEKRHLARAGALLATGEPEALRLRKFLPGQRIETVPLGLTSDARPDYANARAKLGWKPEERVLLFLSRIHVKKGLNLLIEALASMPPPASTRLVIVGEGDPAYVRSLQRYAEEHAAKLPAIEWKGAVWGDARWSYFQGADLFCLPTHSENFGLAVLEACQTGTPALTTTETPWATVLASGHGFIGKPTVESVRQLLSEFFRQPPWDERQRVDLSDWAHAKYDWKVLGPQYAAIYAGLMAQAQKGRRAGR